MEKAIEHFQDQIQNIRYGRISPALIDTIKVDCYGQKLPLKQLAWTTADKSRIMISPYDTSLLNAVNDALENDGFNSYIFSKTQVVVNLPTPSGEDRERAVIQINKLGEEAKISIRNIRKKFRQSLSKEELLVTDKGLQKLTDDAIIEISGLLKFKIESL